MHTRTRVQSFTMCKHVRVFFYDMYTYATREDSNGDALRAPFRAWRNFGLLPLSILDGKGRISIVRPVCAPRGRCNEGGAKKKEKKMRKGESRRGCGTTTRTGSGCACREREREGRARNRITRIDSPGGRGNGESFRCERDVLAG